MYCRAFRGEASKPKLRDWGKRSSIEKHRSCRSDKRATLYLISGHDPRLPLRGTLACRTCLQTMPMSRERSPLSPRLFPARNRPQRDAEDAAWRSARDAASVRLLASHPSPGSHSSPRRFCGMSSVSFGGILSESCSRSWDHGSECLHTMHTRFGVVVWLLVRISYRTYSSELRVVARNTHMSLARVHRACQASQAFPS